MSNTPSPVALITGSARRIGAQIAKTLHAAGFQVVLHYHHNQTAADSLAAQFNSRRANSAFTLNADLCATRELHNLAAEAIDQWGRLDALINNASSFYPTPIGKITETDWDNLIGTNLKAPLFLSQACVPALNQSQGCIINIADIHGERPLKDYPTYCIAKAGNIMLTKSLAKELGPDIRVNGIAPGTIMWPENSAELDSKIQQKIVQKTALKRIGSAEDIANTIRFLLLEAPYITGQIIAVDGGRNLIS